MGSIQNKTLTFFTGQSKSAVLSNSADGSDRLGAYNKKESASDWSRNKLLGELVTLGVCSMIAGYRLRDMLKFLFRCVAPARDIGQCLCCLYASDDRFSDALGSSIPYNVNNSV